MGMPDSILSESLTPRSLTRSSLTHRLTLYYAVAFSLFLCASFLALYWFIGAALDNRMDEDLKEDVMEFSEILASSGLQAVVQAMDKEIIGGEHESVFLFLYSSDGSLIHSTDLEHWAELKPDIALIAQQFQVLESESFVTLEFPLHESDTRGIYSALSPEYMMLIGESNDEQNEVMDLLVIALALVFIFTLPLASLLVWVLTRQSISGIRSVSDAAQDIMSGNLDRRVNVRNQVMEIQTLADTFDAMAERIQGLIHNMREMTDNIAHDLRSPLGRVRLLSESTLNVSSTQAQHKRAAEDTITECDRLITMINTSLDVAETEAGVARVVKTRFDLAALLEDACELFESVADEKKINLLKDVHTPCQLMGDVNSIQRMIANLLDNAIKHTPCGGEIVVATDMIGNTVEIRISDNGIGMDACHHESIFNRFYCIDPSRSNGGCGLGLSYSRAVARAHGGDIQVKSEKDEYSIFTVILPCYTKEEELSPVAQATSG